MIRASRPVKLILCLTAVSTIATGTILASRPVPTPAADAATVAHATEATRQASFTVARERLAVTDAVGAGVESIAVKLRGSDGAGLAALGEGVELKPTFALNETERSSLAANLSPRGSQATFEALDAWYTVRIPSGTDTHAVLDALTADPDVEQVFLPLEASLPVADLTARQGYVVGAPDGINVAYARRYAGGYGERAQIIDIEFDWDLKHEDLARADGSRIRVGTPTVPHGLDDTNHGTAVLGELIGTANGFGVTGIAPKSGIGVVNATSQEHGYNLARAIAVAAANSRPGDVILLEQQLALTRGGEDYIPVEADPRVFDAIRAATDAGIIVIEAAGNGDQDLDALGIGRADSGAILVGAGQVEGCAGYGSKTHPRSRASFSNYGSRVDVQGWGECVTTTGYGDLSADGGIHTWYTWSFSGTSSASPIVAGAAAILSSIIESGTGQAARPGQIRSILKKTGTPQDTSVAGHIGPMPDLARAIKSLGDPGDGASDRKAPAISAPKAVPAVGYQVARDYLVPTRIRWGAKDASGIARYALRVSIDGAAWTDVTLDTPTRTSVTLNLAANHTYRFTVNARDRAGNWGDWKSGPRFKPLYYADDSRYITYAGSWTRAGWELAEGGEVTVSGQKGALASFTFTGRGIAWIASMGTTRGKADVWLDKEYLGRVDLSNPTSLGRIVVFAKRVSADTRHKLVIGVVGTAGTPKIDLDGIVLLR